MIMKENMYQNLKNKQQRQFNEFPIFFAFSDEQFKVGMKKLGLEEKDKDKICFIGAGGYIKKENKKQFEELFECFEKEKKQAIEQDKDGTGFIKDMFYYELGNHEYIITYDLSDTLAALDLTIEDVEKSNTLKKGLKLAKKQYLKEFEKIEKNKKEKER